MASSKLTFALPEVEKVNLDEDKRDRMVHFYGWQIDYMREVFERLYFAEKDTDNKKFLSRVLSQLQ